MPKNTNQTESSPVFVFSTLLSLCGTPVVVAHLRLLCFCGSCQFASPAFISASDRRTARTSDHQHWPDYVHWAVGAPAPTTQQRLPGDSLFANGCASAVKSGGGDITHISVSEQSLKIARWNCRGITSISDVRHGSQPGNVILVSLQPRACLCASERMTGAGFLRPSRRIGLSPAMRFNSNIRISLTIACSGKSNCVKIRRAGDA